MSKNCSSDKLRRSATRLVTMAGVVLFLQGCSGGCSRTSEGSDLPDAAIMPDNPAEVLSHPVVFDKQSIDDALRALESGRELTSVEQAMIIVAAEASVNNLNAFLDDAMRNDDAADTWHVFNELSQAQWPGQTARIIELLEDQPLDSDGFKRLDQMNKAMAYNRELVKELGARMPALRKIKIAGLND